MPAGFLSLTGLYSVLEKGWTVIYTYRKRNLCFPYTNSMNVVSSYASRYCIIRRTLPRNSVVYFGSYFLLLNYVEFTLQLMDCLEYFVCV